MERGAVQRDEWGIPQLWGDTVDDLAYAQGYVAATDRAWQIQVEKWRSEGRLAERLGPSQVPWDRFARRVRLDDTARRCFARLDPETKRWIEAYVAGVNDGLAVADAPEFAATDCAPDQWHPWSPLGVFLVQHVLFGTIGNKLWRAHVAATLGPEAVALFASEGPAGSGSNAWVVPGDLTTGGTTIIAGDPHRVLELPGIYQQVRLACPEFDVIGLAFPGVPGVPHFGHTGGVAWAITNAVADNQDLYREQLRRDGDRVEVRDVDGWVAVPRRVERIAVRGGDPVDVEVIETPRGPVIDVDRGTGEAVSLRAPYRVDSALGFEALLPLLRARRVEDVAEALRHWVEPVNSVLAADTTGAVLRMVAGRVPRRDERCHREPVPGWEPRYRWRDEYAPLPQARVSEIVVNANDRREGDTAELGYDFVPPHRARRIRALLAEGTPHEKIHTDTAIPLGALRGLLERLDAARLGAEAAALRDRLLAWDGRMDADSVDAGAFAAWRSALVKALATHPRLAPVCRPHPFDEVFQPWLDPVARIGQALDGIITGAHRLGGDFAADLDGLAAQALREVAARPAEPWGRRHRLQPVHLSVDPEIDKKIQAVSESVMVSGDTHAVLATASTPGVSDATWRGPIARYVWHLPHRGKSRWIVPFGASGNPDSPHFADQLPLWAEGGLIPVPDAPFHGTARPTADVSLAGRTPAYDEEIDGLGRVSLVVLDPSRDIPLVHGWVTQPRAVFWGMVNHTIDQVREIYEFIDRLPTHHAYLIGLNDTPVGLFQTYQPEADPVGERYPVQPGDVGVHLFLAPSLRPVRGFTWAVGKVLGSFVFRDPAARRIVVEPDVRNDRAVRRLQALGFTLGDQIQLPDKRAQLAFFTREQFQALCVD